MCEPTAARSAVSLRYFNPIGAHPSGTIGEDPHDIPNNLFPFIAQVAVGRRERLNVWGGDWPTADGTGVRDYLHVVDLALGHVAGIAYAQAHSGFMPINLGTGRGTSVLRAGANVRGATGRTVPHVIAARRDGDVAACWADATLARRLLGWQAAPVDRRGLHRRLALAEQQSERVSTLSPFPHRASAAGRCGTIRLRADPDRQDVVDGRCRPCPAASGGSGSCSCPGRRSTGWSRKRLRRSRR